MNSIQRKIKIIFSSVSLCFFWSILAAPEVNLAKVPLNFCQANVGQNLFDHLTVSQSTMDNSEIAISSNLMNEYPYMFQAGFHGSMWSGHLKKFAVTVNKNGGINISKQAEWDAGEILTQSPSSLKRTIVTFNPITKATISFEFDNLPIELQNVFNHSPNPNEMDNLGVHRVNYLYGDRQMEKSVNQSDVPIFRPRESILGDIVNSSPVYKGAPPENKTESNYQSFFNQFKNRKGVVYVGANDGMLHAFSADSGVELFSYIPSPLLSKLPKLTYPSYQHESFMDGKIQVNEAMVSGSWKTVLAAGMGGGAKGVFALDVTKPDAFMESSRVLFEFTEKDDADIGYILTPPHIVKIQDGKNTNSLDNIRYFVIVPGGYNSSNPNGDNFLFLISLDKAPNIPWILNSNYYKLKTNNGSLSVANALSSPGLVLDIQGAISYAYSGDLQGNIWRFDFSKGGNLNAIEPVTIFRALDSNNNPQPITAEPVISYAPGGGYLIQFGTGKYVEYSDIGPANFRSNSFYAIRDTKAIEKNKYFISGRDELASRTLSSVTVDGKSGYKITGDDFMFGDDQITKHKKGWYVDFMNSQKTGERSISAGTIAYGNIYFNTITPSTSCNIPNTSNSYVLNTLTGKTVTLEPLTGKKSHNAELGTPLLILTKISLSDQDSFGRRTHAQYYSILNFNSADEPEPSAPLVSGKAEFKVELKAGRLSWREIQNWQDLKLH